MTHNLSLRIRITAVLLALLLVAGLCPIAMLPLGYPAENAKPLDMHYETRPMDEVVYYDSF